MTYYHLPTDTERRLPTAARRLDTGEWVLGLSDAPSALQEACGFVTITPATRPADTATHTSERSVVRTGDTVAEVWTVVPKSAESLAAEQSARNRATIEGRAATIVSQMNAITATTGALTAAQLSNAVRQIAAATRALTRLAVGLLDAAD